jgi:uncharacterized protein YqeY
MIDVDSLIKAALKSKDAVGLNAWRSVKAKISLKLTEAGREPGKPLTEEEQVQLVRREIKERQEANEFLKAGDPKFEENRGIIASLEAHLPRQITGAEADQLIDQAIASSGGAGPKDMGKVMAALRQSGSALDMAYASAKVKEKLQAKA